MPSAPPTLKDLLEREKLEYTGDWDTDIGTLLEHYAKSARVLVWRANAEREKTNFAVLQRKAAKSRKPLIISPDNLSSKVPPGPSVARGTPESPYHVFD